MFLVPPPQMSSLYLPLPFLFLEKEMANPLQYSCLENPMDRGGLRASPWESEESGRAEHLISPHPHPYSCCVSQPPLLSDALSKGINMGGGSSCPRGESWGSSKLLRLQGRNLWKHPILLLLGLKSSPHPGAHQFPLLGAGITSRNWSLSPSRGQCQARVITDTLHGLPGARAPC